MSAPTPEIGASLEAARAALYGQRDSWYAKTPEQIRQLLEQIRNGPPPAPDIAGLFYRGQTHGLPGKRDAGKSLFMGLVTRDLLNAGGRVLWIDHEQGARRVLRRLDDFGTDQTALELRFHLLDDARGLAPPDAIEAFGGCDLVVLDAMTGQLARSGLSSNSDIDVDKVYDGICRPLAHKHGAAVVIIDHVPHGEGDRPLGTQRKSTAPDVELIFKAVGKFKPGVGGRAKITVGRDRDAAIRPCEFVLAADYTWRLEFAEGEWQPTAIMEKVSIYLEAQTEPVSKATVERDVKGKSAEHKRQAIDELVKHGHVATSSGAHGAILLASITPYRQPENPTSSTSSDLVYTSSRRGSSSPRLPRLPLQGGNEEVDELEAAQDEHLVAILDADPGTHVPADDWLAGVAHLEPDEVAP